MGRKRDPRMHDLARAIHSARIEKGWTQAELAQQACLPLQSIVNYEQARREPMALTLLDLLRTLGVDISAWCEQISRKGETAIRPVKKSRGRPTSKPPAEEPPPPAKRGRPRKSP